MTALGSTSLIDFGYRLFFSVKFSDPYKMESWLKVLVFVAAVALASGNEEATPAKLLVSKQILNKYLVEGMDIVIK